MEAKVYIRQSEAITFFMCGVRRHYQYVQGLSVAPSDVLTIGTVVDDACTYALKLKIETKELPSKDDLLSYAISRFKEREIETDWQDSKPEVALQTVQDLVTVWYDEAAPNINPLTVQEHIKIDLPGRPYGLEGTIDIIEVDGMIRDTKTSGTKYADDEVYTATQAAMYTLLYKLKYGKRPKGFTFDVLTKTKVRKYLPVSGIVSDIQLEKLLKRLDVVYAHIQSDLPPIPASEYGWWCSPKMCPFYSMCKG